MIESVFLKWDLWYCQVNTGKRKLKEIFVGFGWCLWLRMCYIGETCGIVKWIPQSASRKRSLLALNDVYDWECVILVRLVVLSSEYRKAQVMRDLRWIWRMFIYGIELLIIIIIVYLWRHSLSICHPHHKMKTTVSHWIKKAAGYKLTCCE